MLDSELPQPPDDPWWRKWERLRARGRRRFVWIQGVLIWGILTGVTWSLVMAGSRGWVWLTQVLPVALAGFSIGGYVFGSLVWMISEKKYHRHLEQRSTDDLTNAYQPDE